MVPQAPGRRRHAWRVFFTVCGRRHSRTTHRRSWATGWVCGRRLGGSREQCRFPGRRRWASLLLLRRRRAARPSSPPPCWSSAPRGRWAARRVACGQPEFVASWLQLPACASPRPPDGRDARRWFAGRWTRGMTCAAWSDRASRPQTSCVTGEPQRCRCAHGQPTRRRQRTLATPGHDCTVCHPLRRLCQLPGARLR